MKRTPSPALRLAIAGALSQGAAIGIGRFVFTPILPAMMAALALSSSQLGWIASANFAGYLVGALIATAAVFSRAPRFWLLTALAVSTATTAAMGLTSVLCLFMILRALGGVASAFVLVLGSSLVLQRLSRDGRGALAAVHFTGVGLAIVISAVATSLMAAAGYGWSTMWLVSGALSMIALIAVIFLIPAEPSMEAGQSPHSVKTLPGAGFWSLLLAYGLFGFGYVVTATFIVAIVKTYPSAHPVQPFVWALVGASAIPSVPLWTFIGEKTTVRRAFALACVVEAFGVAVSVLRPTADGAVLASILLGGTYMGVTALGLMEARSLSPQNPSRALGRMTAAFGLGQMMGPAFAGWLAERLGGFGLASLIASFALLASAALTVGRPRRLEGR